MIDTSVEQSISSDISSQDTRLQVASTNAQPVFAQSTAGATGSQNAPAAFDRAASDASSLSSWNNIAGLKDLDESLIGQDVPTLPWSSNTYTGSEVWSGANNSAGEQKMPDFVAQLGEMNFSSSAWGGTPLEATEQSISPRD